MADEKIFLGLDIGSNSVGWAVTNEQYQLRKFRNNLMWGVNLFDEASQSAERRSYGTSRRRLDRRQQRIVLLQDFFAKEILKKDGKFFLRLKESALLPEDSENRTHNIFFDDPEYGDKEYFAEYPTIHHLICELMDNKAPHDVRLVYYACAYILAHRGHFLFNVDKEDIADITKFDTIYNEFYNSVAEIEEYLPFDKDTAGMEKVLKKHISVTNKEKELKELLFGGKVPKADEDSVLRYDQLTKIISGGTIKLSDLFCREEYKDLEKNSVCVKNADFSDTLEMLEGQIDELHLNLLSRIKALYDWSLLVDILKGNTMISCSKKAIYDTHKKDLSDIKHLVKQYLDRRSYNEIFRDISEKPNYVSYVYNAPSSENRNKYKKCSQEDFCKFVKSYLEKIVPSDDDKKCYDDILDKCRNSELCPKQVTTDNRVIPYQLYYAELKRILENACTYLPFLNEKDEYGTVAEKILSIMEFRIPYYVGPLVSGEKSKHAWMKRKADGKIYPWNFTDMVDEDVSENEFIRRMTCKCTYVAGEDVLPKYSLLYCKFSVLNEINNIKVNGEPISVGLKQRLYNDKFIMSKAKVTRKRIAEYFSSIGAYSGMIEITGIDDTVKSSMKSYHDFRHLIESGKLSEADVEDIIERITVTTDTKRLKTWIADKYPGLSDDDIIHVSKLKYKDYGRLSRTFFEDVYEIDIRTGERLSDSNIITSLWETNKNLMQLLSLDHRYSKVIEEMNQNYYDDPKNQMTLSERFSEMYIPTAVRRSVIRTIDICKELRSVLKKDPDKIFIEMARGEGDTPKGKRTESRYEQISKFLNESEADNIPELQSQLESIADDGKLRSEKYYLYFLQLGKCAYTGKNISFEDLADKHKWNIDHIWPQSKLKDDSIDNKVLVDSNANGEKGDKYPIKPEIQKEMSGFWYALYKKGMMSEKKYHRLVRNTPFTDEELSGFIARQLVETRQSTKAVAAILKEQFPDSDIVYVKAGIVSEFRQELDMVKCREINDLHHAKDAYLNIVMGNVYDTQFTKSPLNFVRSNTSYSIKLTTLLSRKIERNNEIAWDPDSSFSIVRKMMGKNSIRYVRYCYKRKGGLFNQQPERKKEGLVQRKQGLDTVKYGGYNNKTASFFSKNDLVIIPIDLIDANVYISDESKAKHIAFSALKEFYPAKKISCITENDIMFPLSRKVIKINSVLEIDGFRVNICSKDSKGKYLSVSSAVSVIFDHDTECYIKKIESFKKKKEADKNYHISAYNAFSASDNLALYDLVAQKCMSSPFDRWQKFREAGKILNEGRKLFAESDVETQLISLLKVLSILKTGRSSNCDLSFAGGVANFNTVRFNSSLDRKKNNAVYIIDQSPTGLFEKRSVNLLEL